MLLFEYMKVIAKKYVLSATNGLKRNKVKSAIRCRIFRIHNRINIS